MAYAQEFEAILGNAVKTKQTLMMVDAYGIKSKLFTLAPKALNNKYSLFPIRSTHSTFPLNISCWSSPHYCLVMWAWLGACPQVPLPHIIKVFSTLTSHTLTLFCLTVA